MTYFCRDLKGKKHDIKELRKLRNKSVLKGYVYEVDEKILTPYFVYVSPTEKDNAHGYRRGINVC